MIGEQFELRDWRVGDLISYPEGKAIIVNVVADKVMWVTQTGDHVEWYVLRDHEAAGIIFLSNTGLTYTYTGAEQVWHDFDAGYFSAFFREIN